MRAQFPNPLNDQHCEACNGILDSIAKARELLNACKDCGFDVSGFEEQLSQQEEMAKRIKATFFPDKT